MRDWSKPTPVSQADTIFGPASLRALLPAMTEIPAEFKRDDNPYVRLQQEWFFNGLAGWKLREKPGVDRVAALAHLKAIQASFEPSHEHKQAGVAYLMSLWFDNVPEEQRIAEELRQAEARAARERKKAAAARRNAPAKLPKGQRKPGAPLKGGLG